MACRNLSEVKNNLSHICMYVIELAVSLWWNNTVEAIALSQKKEKAVVAHFKFAKNHHGNMQCYWENILLTNETKVELFSCNIQHYIRLTKGPSFKTSSQQ